MCVEESFSVYCALRIENLKPSAEWLTPASAPSSTANPIRHNTLYFLLLWNEIYMIFYGFELIIFHIKINRKKHINASVYIVRYDLNDIYMPLKLAAWPKCQNQIKEHSVYFTIKSKNVQIAYQIASPKKWSNDYIYLVLELSKIRQIFMCDSWAMAPWISFHIDSLAILTFGPDTFGTHSRKTDQSQCWHVIPRYTVKYQSVDWKDRTKVWSIDDIDDCNRYALSNCIDEMAHEISVHHWLLANRIASHHIDHHRYSWTYWLSGEKERRNERNQFADFVFIHCIFGVDGDGILCHKITQHDDLHRISFSNAQSKIIEKKNVSVKCWPHHRVLCNVCRRFLAAFSYCLKP